MKSKIVALSMSLAVLWVSSAFAGGQWPAGTTVTAVQPVTGANGYVEILLSTNSTGGPVCATNKNYVVVDVSTPSGAIAASVFQMARVTGAAVNVGGNGTCNNTFNSSIEVLNYVSE